MQTAVTIGSVTSKLNRE